MSKKKSDVIFRIVLIAGLVIMGLVAIEICKYKQFWYDEVAIFGYIRSDVSIGDMLHYYATIEVTNLPLFSLVAYPFYHLFPYGAIYVLIPSIVISMAAVYLMVKFADKTMGRAGAYVTLVLLLLSRTMIAKVGVSFRAYAFMIFGSILFIYMMKRLYDNQSDKYYGKVALASFAGIVLAYSHYFGVLFLVATGIGVFVLAILKKMKWRMFVPFVISGLVFLPWFVYALSTTTNDVGSFWISAPGLRNIADMYGFLLGGSKFCLVLWGFAVIYTIAVAIKKKAFLTLPVFYVLIAVVMAGGVYIYSAFVNPGGGLFENRYFFVIFPYMIFSIAYFIGDCFKYVFKTNDKKSVICMISAIGVMSILVGYQLLKNNIKEMTAQHNSYEYFADIIIDNGDIGDEDVLLVLNSYDAVGNATLYGWMDYYLVKRGAKPRLVLEISNHLETVAEEYKDTINTIYVFGDTDHFTYTGTDYVITEQYDFEKGTILKRCD